MDMNITSLNVDFAKREVKAKADFKGKSAKGSFDGIVSLDFDALENVVKGAIVSEFVRGIDEEASEPAMKSTDPRRTKEPEIAVVPEPLAEPSITDPEPTPVEDPSDPEEEDDLDALLKS